MRFSRAQQSLIELAQEPVARGGCCVEEVQDESGLADEQVERALDYVANMSTRANWSGPVNLKLYAGRHWDTICALSELAGSKGNGYLERVYHAFRAFKAQGRKQICLWLWESRKLSPNDQESIAHLFAYVAENLGLNVRVVFLTGMIYRWIPEKRRKGRAPCLFSGRLRARKHELTREGLELLPLDGSVNERDSAAALSA